MRIIFVNRYYFPDHSATSQLLTDLARHLAGRGHHVRVVCSRQRNDAPGARLARRAVLDGVRVHRIPTTGRGRRSMPGRMLDYATFHLAALVTLLVVVRRGDVVVAETDPPLISVTAALATHARGAVLVNWVHDLFPEVASALGMHALSGALGHWLVRRRDGALRAARANVALGDRMAARLAAAGASGIAVIHNWCDGRAVRPRPRDGHARREAWDLDGRLAVIYSGNLGLAHRLDVLIDAAERLRADDRIRFVLIGDGLNRDRLERRVRERDLDNVRFLPYQPREALGETLTAADVHVVSLAPELEGLVVPSKFYGAAAAGAAIAFVGAADGEIAALVEAARCGFRVDAGDAAGLAARLAELAADRDACAAMGARARALFEARFDAPRALASWEAVLAGAAREGAA